MRGKDSAENKTEYLGGIIPAHAGKRCADRDKGPCRRDHPRSCGEKGTYCMTRRASWGSSPLMRGKGRLVVTLSALLGIIPAHAGKSRFQRAGTTAYGDHPRSCGEKVCPPFTLAWAAGSSPLMRGKGTTIKRCTSWAGIIPAHAGKRNGGNAR